MFAGSDGRDAWRVVWLRWLSRILSVVCSKSTCFAERDMNAWPTNI